MIGKPTTSRDGSYVNECDNEEQRVGTMVERANQKTKQHLESHVLKTVAVEQLVVCLHQALGPIPSAT